MHKTHHYIHKYKNQDSHMHVICIWDAISNTPLHSIPKIISLNSISNLQKNVGELLYHIYLNYNAPVKGSFTNPIRP